MGGCGAELPAARLRTQGQQHQTQQLTMSAMNTKKAVFTFLTADGETKPTSAEHSQLVHEDLKYVLLRDPEEIWQL